MQNLTPVHETLTKETLSGDPLYSAALSYFAAIDTAAQISARSARVNTVRMPSFGNFGVASEVQYYFGFPRTIGFPGLQMDIDRVAESTAAKDATSQTRIAFLRALGGQYSAHEHLIPETLFRNGSLPQNDPGQPQAVSAVKAIAIAASQGQRIYTLNAANQAIHSGTISQLGIDSGVKQEITNALATGKEVTVHQGNINYAGFNGSGYVITDPETGAGAYKISTGASGAWFTLVGVAAANLISVLALVSILFTTGVIALPVLAGALIYISLFLAIIAALSFLLAEFVYGGLDFDTYSFSISAISIIVTTLFAISLLALPIGSLAQLAILLYIIFTLRSGGPGQ